MDPKALQNAEASAEVSLKDPAPQALPTSSEDLRKRKTRSPSIGSDSCGDKRPYKQRNLSEDDIRQLEDTDSRETKAGSMVEADSKSTVSLYRLLSAPSPDSYHSRTESIIEEEPEQISPYDRDFDEKVLSPRNIYIDSCPNALPAHRHFKVPEAPTSTSQQDYYTNTRKAPPSTVWIETNEAFLTKIIRDFKDMHSCQVSDAHYANYCMEKFLNADEMLLDKSEANLEDRENDRTLLYASRAVGFSTRAQQNRESRRL